MICGATAITLLSLLTAVISVANLEIPDPPVAYPPKVLDGIEGQVCPSDDQLEDARDVIDDEIRSILQDLLQCPGNQQDNPASSCLAVFQCNPRAPSAEYWIATSSNTTQVYCDMSQELCGIQGGWAQIGYLDMTNPNHSCPSGWREFTAKRTCGITPTHPVSAGSNFEGGYETITFSIDGMSYSQICGKIIGYQYGSPNAFGPYDNEDWPSDSIDEIYMDGVSVTYGANPRTHIWSLAASDADSESDNSACPCTTRINWLQNFDLPPWVGSDYFCESGVTNNPSASTFYPDDPLWDGQGCPVSTAPCCGLNSPPWFYKQLSESTDEGIEVRVMSNQLGIENVPIELIEIYVQ